MAEGRTTFYVILIILINIFDYNSTRTSCTFFL